MNNNSKPRKRNTTGNPMPPEVQDIVTGILTGNISQVAYQAGLEALVAARFCSTERLLDVVGPVETELKRLCCVLSDDDPEQTMRTFHALLIAMLQGNEEAADEWGIDLYAEHDVETNAPGSELPS